MSEREPKPSFGSEEQSKETIGGGFEREKNEEKRRNNDEHKLRLQKELNFTNQPGRHTLDSEVVASRVEEVQLLRSKIDKHPELVDFEQALYKPENIHLIPLEDKDEAEKIAKRKFEKYVKKYEKSGATIENVVEWEHDGLPGAGSNKMHIYDTENKWNTWALHAVVEDEGSVVEGKYLPKYVVAYHELMHVEETPKGAPESSQEEELAEVITTVKTIILVDEIYKEIHGLSLSEEIDYQREIILRDRRLEVGVLANFYRDLERKHGGIGEAVLSEESLNYISNTRNDSE